MVYGAIVKEPHNYRVQLQFDEVGTIRWGARTEGQLLGLQNGQFKHSNGNHTIEVQSRCPARLKASCWRKAALRLLKPDRVFRSKLRRLKGVFATFPRILNTGETMMVQYLLSVLSGVVILVTWIIAKLHLVALGYWDPYEMVAVMWLTIFVFLIIWHRTSRRRLVSSIVISSMICVPIVAYLFNRWLGFAVGAICFYLASKWAEKAKDLPSS